jgi:hypothetical protein
MQRPPMTIVLHPGSTQVVNIQESLPVGGTAQTLPAGELRSSRAVPVGCYFFFLKSAGLTTRVTVAVDFTPSSSTISTRTSHLPAFAGLP